MHSIDRNTARHERARLRTALVMLALAVSALVIVASATGAGASTHGHSAKHRAHTGASKPVRAVVLTPAPGDRTSSSFNVDVSLQARNARGNNLLSDYTSAFTDPTGPDGNGNPAFHPGASTAAPGLVVTLSTTPSMARTPLAGPRTNLAGVFQINSVTRNHGLNSTWNDWQVTSPGFFGKNTSATLTVYAVRGKAPDVVPAGGLTPISNVVRETYRIGA